jgi:hypothetical protein
MEDGRRLAPRDDHAGRQSEPAVEDACTVQLSQAPNNITQQSEQKLRTSLLLCLQEIGYQNMFFSVVCLPFLKKPSVSP